LTTGKPDNLLAFSTIPEVWVGREPPAIAADLADLLIGSLEMDFAFVRLRDPTGCQVVEVARGNQALMKIWSRRFKEVSIDQARDTEGDITPNDPEDWGPNPEERYSQEELRRILDISVSKLDPKYRIVFQLRDIEGLTTDETARALDLSVPAVKTRLARTRLQLRNSLDIYFRPMQCAESRSRLAERGSEDVDVRRTEVFGVAPSIQRRSNSRPRWALSLTSDTSGGT
jgi:hypothetical protein